VLAIRPKTGEIGCYYQYTPNDVYDVDATDEQVLADLQIGGQMLKPGAYGVGFVGNKFVVMDIGANDVFSVDSAKDQNLKPAMPLQVVSGEMGHYRLYKGRDYVEFSRLK